METINRATFIIETIKYETLCSIHTLKYYEKSSTNEGFFCILGTILKSFKGINSKITSNTDEDVCL